MATNPYEEASRSRAKVGGGGRIWLLAFAAAALATTVAWAAPLGGKRPTAELSYGSHHIAPSDDRVTLIETVTFEEAQPDEEYVLATTPHALGDDGSDQGAITVGGELFEASASVVPADDGKTLSLPITLDAKDLAGSSVVCFTTLSKGDEVVASWQDIGDEAQTVRFPALSVSFDGTERGSELLAQKSARIKATVSYANVVPEKIYRVTATLVDASTRQPISDEQGKEISTSLRLTPSKEGGSASVTIDFDATPHAGKRVGMRANLATQSQTLAICETPEAAGLTVPRITSTATSSSGSGSTAKDTMTITETVSYEGLVPGTTYVLKSTVRDGDTGTMLLDGDGKQVEGAEVACEITPNEPNGSTKVTHTLDASSVRGGSFALCDVLTRKEDGGMVATWDGLAASSHVLFGSASSTTVGAHTNMACEPAVEQAGVRSVISYRNLEPGCEYAVEGTLRRGSDDGGVGGAITDARGNAITARATFTPEEPDGTAELAYAFDATGLAGSRIVTQESIVQDGTEVVRVTSTQEVTIPLVEVSLSDEGTGLSETCAGEDTRLVAKVGFGSLPQLDGMTIVCELLDVRTGRVLLDERGNEASSRTPIESPADGDAKIALLADTRNLAGHGVVARARIELEGTTIASTPDAWGERAMVSIPRVTATLADEASGARVASGESALVASVICEGMSPSLPHSALVKIVDADTGESIRGRDGRELAGIATLPAGEASATADVAIKLDGQDLAGRTLAIEETLSCGDAVTARGADNADASRKVRIPRVSVDARSDAFGDGELPCDEHAKAYVTFSYENLEPGLSYALSYVLADAEDGRDVEGTAGETAVKPQKPDGTVEVPVTIDTRELAGRRLVARSSLSLDGNALAEARTPDDHSLRIPAITTSLHSKVDGGKTVDPGANVALVDAVSYVNLTPGVEYVLEGELVDASTGKAAMATVETGARSGAAANSSTSSGADTATRGDAFQGKPDATTVWVTDDGTYHLEKTCVLATGTLRRTTLGIAKAASKVACKEESGAGAIEKKPEASATTAPSQSTEKREEQRASTATARFTPKETNGTVEVELAINARGLEGKRLVATQVLRRGDHTVALHKDLGSEAQTVAVSEYGTTANDGSSENMGQTGTGILPFVALGVAAALVVFGTMAIVGLGKGGGNDGEKR